MPGLIATFLSLARVCHWLGESSRERANPFGQRRHTALVGPGLQAGMQDADCRCLAPERDKRKCEKQKSIVFVSLIFFSSQEIKEQNFRWGKFNEEKWVSDDRTKDENEGIRDCQHPWTANSARRQRHYRHFFGRGLGLLSS
jgi:hypothetical protein